MYDLRACVSHNLYTPYEINSNSRYVCNNSAGQITCFYYSYLNKTKRFYRTLSSSAVVWSKKLLFQQPFKAKEDAGMLLFTWRLLMMLPAAVAEVNVKDLKSLKGKVLTTAISYISPNSKPPPGTETPVRGTVMMTQLPLGLIPTTMHIQLKGLRPNTVHGFHIHEYGDTVSNGCQSTGSHYNPLHLAHGAPTDKIRHIGDLGNLVSDKDGVVNTVVVDPLVSLFGPLSVAGRAFVIHEKIDDLGKTTSPDPRAVVESLKTGNAGARLGCGVIRLAPVKIGGQDQEV